MVKRHGIVIDPNKSKGFCEFIRTHGKDAEFWRKNAEIASTKVDKDELDQLMNGD